MTRAKEKRDKKRKKERKKQRQRERERQRDQAGPLAWAAQAGSQPHRCAPVSEKGYGLGCFEIRVLGRFKSTHVDLASGDSIFQFL